MLFNLGNVCVHQLTVTLKGSTLEYDREHTLIICLMVFNATLNNISAIS